MPTGDGGPNRRAPFVGGASAAPHDTGVWDKTKIIDEKPLNMLSGDKFAERSLFDEKVASSSGYQYDGTKGGVAWKMKVRGYFISKVPALVGILKWAEKHDQDKVEADSFDSVVSHFMDRPRQDVLNTQIWGFLGACLPPGTALTLYNRAEDLNGLDAWRTIVRVIDNGLALRLEDLRDEVRMIHTKRIKDLESVPTGVAEFERLLNEYVEAGGPGYDGDEIWKSDLRRILPQKLREDTTLLNIDSKTTFSAYREMVLSQARTLIHLRRQSGGLQGAVESRPADMPELGGRVDDEDSSCGI